jgi:Mg-chelatase subunit ChlD
VENNETGAFRSLKLSPGDYFVSVENNRGQPACTYRLCVRQVVTEYLLEAEPNPKGREINPIHVGKPIHGRMSSRDKEDGFIWEVGEGESGRRFDLYAVMDRDDVEVWLQVFDADRKVLYAKAGKGNLVAGDFSPAPGTYAVTLESRNNHTVRYQLEIRDAGPLPKGWEREPNDKMESSNIPVIQEIRDGQAELLGRLEGHWGDLFAVRVMESGLLYHVVVAGPEKVSLSQMDPRRGKLSTVQNGIGEAAALVDLRLPVGLSYFMIEGAEGDYAVNVQRVPVPDGNLEWEPNDQENRANLLQMGEWTYGRHLNTSDRDWFRFVVRQAMNYRVQLEAPSDGAVQVHVKGASFSRTIRHTSENSPTIDEREYLLPGRYAIRLASQKPSAAFYRLRVVPDPVPDGMTAGVIDGLEVELGTQDLTALAFNDFHQKVRQQVVLHNGGSEMLSLSIMPVSANLAARIGDGSVIGVKLQPGERRSLEFDWILEPGQPGSERILLQLGISDGQRVSLHSSNLHLVNGGARAQLLPAQPLLDPALAGAFNLNASDFGAKPVLEPVGLYGGKPAPSASRLGFLIDGVLANRSFRGHAAVVELAGDGQTELIGSSIDLHGGGTLWESAREFSIDVSTDGKSFKEILRGELEARTGDQIFHFEQPVKARFARLRLHNTHSGKTNEEPHVGEWRMLARPDVPVAALGRFDLLDKHLGGHRIIQRDRQWVYGLQHNRAARIDSVVWVQKGGSVPNTLHPTSFTLEGSDTSPVGPWKEIGTYALKAPEGSEALRLEFPIEAKPWVRFLRFSWPVAEGVRFTQEPESLVVYEVPVSRDYRSIMGEWRGPTDFAYREYAARLAQTGVAAAPQRRLSSGSKPAPLPANEWLESVVWIDEDWEDWYAFEGGKLKQVLELSVESKPFFKVMVEIRKASGEPVAMSERSIGGDTKIYRFATEPGEGYRVHVREPRRSIVYLWDVSGSMGKFVESIENAVMRFAESINPRTEQVHLLPFDRPIRFLTQQWETDPHRLQDIVRNYKSPDSSDAFENLDAAIEVLKDQPGTKAAIVITDCEAPRRINERLWNALERVKPAVFTFQTSDETKGYGVEQDDMQDWAAVGGGFYQNTRDAHELDFAFEKVQAYLRRPAPYRMRLTVPELSPSTIEVKDSRDAMKVRVPANDGVLLIVDASASMRELLPDGEMKINAAKAVIESLTQDYLPDGINFGLRVFGHRGGTDCASELMLPVAPLESCSWPNRN